MYNQISNQLLALSKNFADTAFKAHHLAMEGMERITEMNMKALENNLNTSVAFWSEATEARGFDSMKAMWPKSISLVKNSAEKMYHHTQEVLSMGIKTSEALGNLAKSAFEAANDNMQAHANVAKKAAK